MQRNIEHWKVWRVDQNIVARMKQSHAVIATAVYVSHNLSYAVTRKFIQIILGQINDNLISPDVPALMVTPPENPDSIRIELIGSATSRNLGRRQNQVKKKERLSSQERYFQVLVHRYPGTSQSTPPSCRSIHTPSSPLRTPPNGKRFQL